MFLSVENVKEYWMQRFSASEYWMQRILDTEIQVPQEMKRNESIGN